MKDLAKEVIVILVTVVLSMGGYWMLFSRDLVTKVEATELIAAQVAVTKVEIQSLVESRKELTTALKENTEAVQDLRVEFAKISKR
jgi:multisubunit Na+/H+ antiporter MnhC subunit